METRFKARHPPRCLQWLADDRSIHAGARTIDMAIIVGLEPCFRSVGSPEGNVVVEVFVGNFQRDYVGVNLFRGLAITVATAADPMADYNHTTGSPFLIQEIQDRANTTRCMFGLRGQLRRSVENAG